MPFWAAVLPFLKAAGMQAASNVLRPDGQQGGSVIGAGLQGGMGQMQQPQSVMPQDYQLPGIQRLMQQYSPQMSGMQQDPKGMAGQGFLSRLYTGRFS